MAAPGYMMDRLIKRFRTRVNDTDPLKNILDQKLEFTDDQIEGYIIESLYEINEREPETNHKLEKFPKTTLLLDGAMIQMYRAKGLLHLRNQVSYSDAGFSVNLNDKSGHYAQWLSQEVSMFEQKLRRFKRSQVPSFRGVSSPAGWCK